MTFRSLYRHGFARVASCTMRCAIADPAANAEAVLRVAKTCDERSAALAIFPELAVSGYAIDDLLLQDPLLDAVEAGLERDRRRLGQAAAAAAGRSAAAPCQRQDL